MWPSRAAVHQQIVSELQAASAAQGLKGVPDAATIDTLALQFVASLRREDYYRRVQSKLISPQRADPNNPSFDTERAVAFHMQQGDVDEAGWLIFLMTHFARRPDTHWRRLQDVYGRLGAGVWDWVTVSANPAAFYQWLDANWQNIRGGFGNHRKYESLRPTAQRPMRTVVADYLAWIGAAGHAAFFANAVRAAGNDPHTIFDYLYGTMTVRSFGRLAKFDYLSLVGRYGLAPIEAGTAYLDGATGPGRGARLLVDGDPTSATGNSTLQVELDKVNGRLQVGMAVMEDSLCNWQKSPRHFVHFKG
jgi:Alpha-glutamyl/putrescinyl thymine pyrophosphorylase clade 3